MVVELGLYLDILIVLLLIYIIISIKNNNKHILNILTNLQNNYFKKTDLSKSSEKHIIRNNVKILNDEKYYYTVLNSISNAKKEINIIMFSIYHCRKTNELINEIIKARKRGVMIRIILDGEIESNKIFCNKFSAERIPIKIDSENRIHNKLILIDDDITIIGSHNWTDKALFENKESSLFIKDYKINKEEKKYFEYLWNSISKN